MPSAQFLSWLSSCCPGASPGCPGDAFSPARQVISLSTLHGCTQDQWAMPQESLSARGSACHQQRCRPTRDQSNGTAGPPGTRAMHSAEAGCCPRGTLLNPCSLTPTCDKVDKANDDVRKNNNNFSLGGMLWRALMRCSRSPAAHIPLDMGKVRVGDEHSAMGLSCPKTPPCLAFAGSCAASPRGP